VAEPQCDVLFEVFSGSLGSVHLGRLLKGHDAGRLVALRKLAGAPSAELASAADLGRSIAHPKLAKVLGVIRERDAAYIASEYISGVTLFELGRAVVGRNPPVEPAVAVRIILDALKAGHAAQRLLKEAMGMRSVRCLYPECIWIADFGETFLSEVLVAPLLAPKEAVEASAAAADVRSAALELMRLACGALAADDPLTTDLSSLPEELQEVLARALGDHGVSGFASLEEFITALGQLDPSLIASEDQVGLELRRFMATVLNVRRQKLDMLERGSAQTDEEDEGDETKFFRAAVVKTESRDTTRPPPSLGGPGLAKAASVPSGAIKPMAINSVTASKPAPKPTPAPANQAIPLGPDGLPDTPSMAEMRAAKRVGLDVPAITRSEPPDEPTVIFRRGKADANAAPAWAAELQLEAGDPDTGTNLETTLESFVRTKTPRQPTPSEADSLAEQTNVDPSEPVSVLPRRQAATRGTSRAVFVVIALLTLAAAARVAWVVQHDHSPAVTHWDLRSVGHNLSKLWH